MDNKGEVWKSFVVMIPTLGAALITTTRIMDARHHPFDVISGSILGIICAWCAYRQYFPSISEPWKKGRAYPIRTWASSPRPPPHADQADLDEYNAAVEPLQRTDSEYGMTTGRERPFTPKITTPVSPPQNPFEPHSYSRRRADYDGNRSSSSADVDEQAGVYEMQSSYSNRFHNESTTHLDPRYHAETEYISPQHSHQPPSPPFGGRPMSPVGPLRNV